MKQFTITSNDANQRLDKFLKKLFPKATRSLIYKFNRKDKIKIKTLYKSSHIEEAKIIYQKFKKKDNEYKLQVWDEIKIYLSDDDFFELSKKDEIIKLHKKEVFNKKNIIFQDKDLFIINKDPWINVHSTDHNTKEINIISQVQDYLWDKLNSLTFKPSLIHRIDKNTSWILMIWKTKDILTKLVADLKKQRKIKKTYYAIVLWKLPKKKWKINKNILRIQNAQNENKIQVSEKGQIAITHYKLIKEYILKIKQTIQIVSEVEIEIKTGRMHQIRVHMADLWNPILLDNTYWNKKLNSFFKKLYWLNRQALHSWKIKFFHYGREKIMNLEAKIKEDLINFISKIKK